MVDFSSWFYTLSTEAQVLAAIYGLYMVFISIRYSQLEKKLEYYGNCTFDAIASCLHLDVTPSITALELQEQNHCEKVKTFEESIDLGLLKGSTTYIGGVTVDKNFLVNYKKFVNLKSRIAKKFIIVSSTVLAVIISQLLLILFTEYIGNYHYIALLTVVSTAFSMLLILHNIVSVIRS